MTNNNTLRIDGISIRLKGIPTQTAQAALDGFGKELAEAILGHHDRGASDLRVGDIDAGKIGVSPDIAPSVLRREMVERIAERTSKEHLRLSGRK